MSKMNSEIKTAKDAYFYSRDVIKGPWPEGEELIATEILYSYWYANILLNANRFPQGEPIIATNPRYAYMYARDIIKGRWLPGELTIMFSEYANDYAEICDIEL